MIVRVVIEALVDGGQVREWSVQGVQEVAVMDGGALNKTDQPIGVDGCIRIAGDFLVAVALQKARDTHHSPSGIVLAR